MKKLLFLLTAVAVAPFANAQKIPEKEVPAIVAATLKNHYPNAKELKWEKENGNYEAGFTLAETGYSVLIDALGSIVETEVEISADALPADAKVHIAKNYPGKKIKEAAKITGTKGIVRYEAEVNGRDLIFDNSGKFLKTVTNKDND